MHQLIKTSDNKDVRPTVVMHDISPLSQPLAIPDYSLIEMVEK